MEFVFLSLFLSLFFLVFIVIFTLLLLFSVKKYILQYQSGSIGLFPLHTSGKNEESHVRDNVYCAMAVWALGLAYRSDYVISAT